MHKVIDTPWCTTEHLQGLRAAGVQTIIRYFNRANSSKLPEKRIEVSEAGAIANAGISLLTIFQQRGGAEGHIEDLDLESGRKDAERALELAERIGQREGSAIYFAVDYDYWRPSELAKIVPYFGAVRDTLQDKYRVGVYGSGTVGWTMRRAGFADLVWLAAARGWSGTRDMLETDDWSLYQIFPPVNEPLPHDGNIISPAWHDYGQFVPANDLVGIDRPEEAIIRAPDIAIMEINARSGLKLRRGPSQEFDVEAVLPHGTLVNAIRDTKGWMQVDVQGDGLADGYMYGEFLDPVVGGVPAPITNLKAADNAGPVTPYIVAVEEMTIGVREISGIGNNPRIVMYHNTTDGRNTDDGVAWCSSFVNYCVERAGFEGTDSQWALSWHHWGQNVTDNPKEGDIVVFERVGSGGHVGFYRSDQGDCISVLGGNQGNQVKVSSYPKNGYLGDTEYRLRSIRRP